jgi:hypothetical protein
LLYVKVEREILFLNTNQLVIGNDNYFENNLILLNVDHSHDNMINMNEVFVDDRQINVREYYVEKNERLKMNLIVLNWNLNKL